MSGASARRVGKGVECRAELWHSAKPGSCWIVIFLWRRLVDDIGEAVALRLFSQSKICARHIFKFNFSRGITLCLSPCAELSRPQQILFTLVIPSDPEFLFHVSSRNALLVKAALEHRIGLADEDVGRDFVFGAPKLSESCKKHQVIKCFDWQRQTERSRFREIGRASCRERAEMWVMVVAF